MSTKKIGAGLTVLMTLVVAALRITIVPQLQSNGQTSVSYIVIGAIALALVILFFLMGKTAEVPRVRRKAIIPAAAAGVLFGATLVLSTVWDIVQLAVNNISPPPGDYVTGNIDWILLIGIFVFGVLGGVFMIQLCLRWITSGHSRSSALVYAALIPPLWMWMRLARYELSYASAVDVSKSFYDFVMFILALLFLFGFARYISGIGRQKRLPFFAAGTAILALSGTLAHYFFQITNNADGLAATVLLGPADLTLGIFALLMVYVLAFAEREAGEDELRAELAEAEGQQEQSAEPDQGAGLN